MKNKLYIIGNGFDLHHGIQSSFEHFREYLEHHHYDIYENVDKYLSQGDESFWSEFESNLAHFDKDSVLEDASDFLVGYGAEDWSDAYHHDYQYEIDRVVTALTKGLLKCLTSWISQLLIPTEDSCRKLHIELDKDALFLNFNYTNSLNKIYSVPEANILHIHGKYENENSVLILGHDWSPEEKNREDWDEDTDVRIMEGDKIIESYFASTFKPTDKVISSNKEFFSKLKDIKEIIVLGHSIGDVDFDYFYEIKKYIDVNLVKWRISYHCDKEPIARQFEKLDIKDNYVEYFPISEKMLCRT